MAVRIRKRIRSTSCLFTMFTRAQRARSQRLTIMIDCGRTQSSSGLVCPISLATSFFCTWFHRFSWLCAIHWFLVSSWTRQSHSVLVLSGRGLWFSGSSPLFFGCSAETHVCGSSSAVKFYKCPAMRVFLCWHFHFTAGKGLYQLVCRTDCLVCSSSTLGRIFWLNLILLVLLAASRLARGLRDWTEETLSFPTLRRASSNLSSPKSV